MTIYAVYHQSADSYHSLPEFPIAAFSGEDEAIAFAKTRKGYGYGVDWFVKPILLDPQKGDL